MSVRLNMKKIYRMKYIRWITMLRAERDHLWENLQVASAEIDALVELLDAAADTLKVNTQELSVLTNPNMAFSQAMALLAEANIYPKEVNVNASANELITMSMEFTLFPDDMGPVWQDIIDTLAKWSPIAHPPKSKDHVKPSAADKSVSELMAIAKKVEKKIFASGGVIKGSGGGGGDNLVGEYGEKMIIKHGVSPTDWPTAKLLVPDDLGVKKGMDFHSDHVVDGHHKPQGKISLKKKLVDPSKSKKFYEEGSYED